MELYRPKPPARLIDEPWAVAFEAGGEAAGWIVQTFIEDGAPLFNPDHQALQQARIGLLWTNADNARRGRVVIGTAEVPHFMGSRWVKARQEQQMREWFGDMPDFVITLDANYCHTCDDAAFCALVEHELYHCRQQVDEYDAPKFNKQTGEPMWTIQGHDVEEFVGVVTRYGVGPADGALARLVEAAASKPSVGRATIAAACGTCKLRVV